VDETPLYIPTPIGDIADAVWTRVGRALDPNNPTSILTRIGDPTGQALANLVAKLGNPKSAYADAELEATYLIAHQTPQTFNDTNAHDLTTLQTPPNYVVLPSGVTLKDAPLLIIIEVQNRAATLNRIDVDIYARKSGAAWGSPIWTEDDVISLPAVDGARDTLVCECDIASLMAGAAGEVFEFKATIQQSAAATVQYLYWGLVVLRYVMG